MVFSDFPPAKSGEKCVAPAIAARVGAVRRGKIKKCSANTITTASPTSDVFMQACGRAEAGDGFEIAKSIWRRRTPELSRCFWQPRISQRKLHLFVSPRLAIKGGGILSPPRAMKEALSG